MLKTISAADPAASLEVKDENPENVCQGVHVEDQDEKDPAQKSRKSQKSQKTAKSKKWIYAKKAETSRARNLSSQSGAFLTTNGRTAFTKSRQAFIEALILNHFNPERHISIQMDALGYAISEIFSQLTLDDLG